MGLGSGRGGLQGSGYLLGYVWRLWSLDFAVLKVDARGYRVLFFACACCVFCNALFLTRSLPCLYLISPQHVTRSHSLLPPTRMIRV
jgi:hypothetical protein